MSDRELGLTRVVKAAPAAVWRCWTEPALLEQWFCPLPWRAINARLDPKPGGDWSVTMLSPEGVAHENPGICLEADPGRRLVVTDAYSVGWEPAAKPFMTAILTFDALPDGHTRYTARVLHWTVDDRETHEKMGFHQGWGVATDQLEALAATLG